MEVPSIQGSCGTARTIPTEPASYATNWWQPVRGPEIMSLKVCNTANSLRNIYIYKGLFCTLVPYNKASAATQQAF